MATKRKTGKTTARKAAKMSAREAAGRTKAKARGTVARRKRAGGAAKAARQQVAAGLSLRAATPGFTVNDIHKSIAFYRDVLGFEVEERWEHDGVLGGAEMKAGRVSLYLGQDDWKKGRDRVKGQGFRIYCSTTQDVDAIAERLRSAGVALLEEPKDQPWGGRDFAVVDPDGFTIAIAGGV